MADRPNFGVIHRSIALAREHKASGDCCFRIIPLPSAVQQPLHIFFSCAFIRASSTPIVSTYFSVPGFAAAAPAVAAGFAAADLSADAASAALSEQASLALAAGVVLAFR